MKGQHEAVGSGNRLLGRKVDETASGSCPGGVPPSRSAPENFSSQILHGNVTHCEPGFQFLAPCPFQSTDVGRRAHQRRTSGSHCGDHEDMKSCGLVQVYRRFKEAADPSETSAHFYQTTRRHIPDGRYLDCQTCTSEAVQQ